jgi:hypothetical protein
VTNPPDAPEPSRDAARFRATLVRVMGVQLAALVLLWLVQSRYSV